MAVAPATTTNSTGFEMSSIYPSTNIPSSSSPPSAQSYHFTNTHTNAVITSTDTTNNINNNTKSNSHSLPNDEQDQVSETTSFIEEETTITNHNTLPHGNSTSNPPHLSTEANNTIDNIKNNIITNNHIVKNGVSVYSKPSFDSIENSIHINNSIQINDSTLVQQENSNDNSINQENASKQQSKTKNVVISSINTGSKVNSNTTAVTNINNNNNTNNNSQNSNNSTIITSTTTTTTIFNGKNNGTTTQSARDPESIRSTFESKRMSSAKFASFTSAVSATPTDLRQQSYPLQDTPSIHSTPIVLSRASSSEALDSSGGSTSAGLKSSVVKKASSLNKRQKSDKEVLVGTPVKEGHVNYMLMYDMLTGIRISVSRCTAKPPRALEPSDYSAAHKIAFDITGNEMTPRSKYDFKFKDYAPYVFRIIRECFHVDASDYLTSLTGKYVLSELGSPGKSGSFFYFSQDYRFIIKTIHHYEHRFLLKILSEYVKHVTENPNTLISRIFGLHRVKLPGNKKIHFVVMGNVFPANKDIHEIYDLKGSLSGRMFPEKEAENNPRAVLKDKNWLYRGRQLLLGPEKAKLFMDQIHKDVEFLKSQRIMDYSLLVGIHDMVKGNKENIRDQTLSVFEPDHEAIVRAASTTKPRKRVSKSTAIRKMLSESEAMALGPSSSKLPELPPEERRHIVFYQDFGGFQATSPHNNVLPVIYYLGIIDIFTKYDFAKRMETFFKSVKSSSKKISSVHPNLYGTRFVNFIQNIIVPTTSTNDHPTISRQDQTNSAALPSPSISPTKSILGSSTTNTQTIEKLDLKESDEFEKSKHSSEFILALESQNAAATPFNSPTKR